MKLISCDRCGVVLDQDKIIFDPVFEEDQITPIDGTYVYDRDLSNPFVPATPCPVCGTLIKKEGKDDR